MIVDWRALELGDHVGQRLVVGEGEGALVSVRVSVAFGVVESRSEPLEPDLFAAAARLINEIGSVSDATSRRRALASDRPRAVAMSASLLRGSWLALRECKSLLARAGTLDADGYDSVFGEAQQRCLDARDQG